jgi:hypothetical protein
MEIPDIDVGDIEIGTVDIPSYPAWLTTPPQAIPPAVPVTETIGVPIVNIPGCVEAHEQQDARNQNISSDDEKGVKVFCDGQQPSFNPIQYEPDQILRTPPPKVDTRRPEPPPPELPKSDLPVEVPPVQCPTRDQELKNPVGKILEGNKMVMGYEWVDRTQECLMVTEQLSIPQQVVQNIPNSGKVTATASIAVIATTSALLAKPLADLLLRVVKPVTKKVVKKIAAIRGKTVPVQSVRERRAEQHQRNHAVKALRSVFPRRKKG